jgi:Gpi18-like mannosyltransferase
VISRIYDNKYFGFIPLLLFLIVSYFTSYRLENSDGWGALFLSLSLSIFIYIFLLLIRRSAGRYFAAVSFFCCLLVYLRLCFFDIATSDYTMFLKPWTEQLREAGGLAGLDKNIGNYNVPYLVFLALFSYTEFSELYLIKLLSVFFDLVLAFSLMKTVSVFTQSTLKKSLCLVLTLLLPTVFINSSIWGQCDSIYVSLAVLSLWLMLSDRPILSLAALALSFAFKLQAVFIMPVYLLFMFTGRLKWYQLPVFPAVYVLAVSPAIIAGRGFWDTILIYFNTAGTVGSALNYNSPSMYSLYYFYWLDESSSAAAAKAGVVAAFILCLIVFLVFFIRRRHINKRSLFFAALLFAVAIPLLLPHMHDRYFYLCDVLILAAAFLEPASSPLVLFSQFASLLGYHAYFFMRYLLPMRWGFAALLVLTITAAYMCASELFQKKRR